MITMPSANDEFQWGLALRRLSMHARVRCWGASARHVDAIQRARGSFTRPRPRLGMCAAARAREVVRGGTTDVRVL